MGVNQPANLVAIAVLAKHVSMLLQVGLLVTLASWLRRVNVYGNGCSSNVSACVTCELSHESLV